MNSRMILTHLVFLIFGVVLAYFAVSAVKQRSHAELLRSTGVTTEGRIEDVFSIKGPKTVTYSYSIDGKPYEATGLVSSFRNSNVGDPIKVYYLPNDPRESEVDVEGVIDQSSKVLLFLVVATVMLAACYLLVLAIMRQRSY